MVASVGASSSGSIRDHRPETAKYERSDDDAAQLCEEVLLVAEVAVEGGTGRRRLLDHVVDRRPGVPDTGEHRPTGVEEAVAELPHVCRLRLHDSPSPSGVLPDAAV